MSVNTTIFLPATADRPAEPAPYLMTEEDVVRLLRIDSADPYSCLRRYRNKGQLAATQVGNHVRYLLPNVIEFLERATKENKR
jgi:hypothetical protein